MTANEPMKQSDYDRLWNPSKGPTRTIQTMISNETYDLAANRIAQLEIQRNELRVACKEFIRVIDCLKEVNVLGDWPVVRETLPAIRAAIIKS